MKTYILLLVVAVSTLSFSQETTFKLHSLSAGIGLTGSNTDFSQGYFDLGGLNATIDATANYKQNLFSVYLGMGFQEYLIYSEEFFELNTTYGRLFPLNDWLLIEVHGGLGYFNWRSKHAFQPDAIQLESTLGFPLRVKLMFNFSKHFSMGFNPNLNINAIANTYTLNLLAQYQF